MNEPGPIERKSMTREERVYRRIIIFIPIFLLAFGLGETALALFRESRQLLKDAIDWAYDVVIFGLAAIVFGRSRLAERRATMIIAVVLVVAGLHTGWDLYDKIANPRPIELFTLGFAVISAVVLALFVVALLWQFRASSNPLIEATWLASRNDAISTTLGSFVALFMRLLPVRWPEYAMDVLSIGLSFQAAWLIWRSLDKQTDERP